MAQSTSKHDTEVAGVEKVEVKYRQRKMLFGLIRWWEEVRADRLGKHLFIATGEWPEEILLNGMKMVSEEEAKEREEEAYQRGIEKGLDKYKAGVEDQHIGGEPVDPIFDF